MTKPSHVIDLLARPLGVLRLSLTARCNLACPYCCPESIEPPGLLHTYDQLRLIHAACQLGAHTLRLTGGEPLLSDRLWPLLDALSLGRQSVSHPFSRLKEVAITTNGSLLDHQKARRLCAAGVDRITISLDAVDGASIARMAGLRSGPEAGSALLERVLAGIDAARAAGYNPAQGRLKLNAVIQRGHNDDQLIPLAQLARQQGLQLRLIEYMDVGNRNGWCRDQVMPAKEMIQLLHRHWPLQSIGRPVAGTCRQWSYKDGGGIVGTIASITEPFCSDCNRLRITADGQAFTCLFASEGLDLRPWLRMDVSDSELAEVMAQLWTGRSDRFSEERGLMQKGNRHAEMAYLGG